MTTSADPVAAEGAAATPRTLLDKLWDRHVVCALDENTDLLYIDLHLVQEVSSPQAFAALDLAGRSVRRPELTIGVLDHVVPTLRTDPRPIDPQISTQLQRSGHRWAVEILGEELRTEKVRSLTADQ